MKLIFRIPSVNIVPALEVSDLPETADIQYHSMRPKSSFGRLFDGKFGTDIAYQFRKFRNYW